MGKGLLRVSRGVTEPFSVPLKGLSKEFTASLFGTIFHRTSFGR